MTMPLYSGPLCDVNGCRKRAAVVLVRGAALPGDEYLCEPCYLNAVLSHPEVAVLYRKIRFTTRDTEIAALPENLHGPDDSKEPRGETAYN
jgi:hypothetical protein